jgi:hypothetical protein
MSSTPVGLTTLGSLQGYASRQTELIKSLSHTSSQNREPAFEDLNTGRWVQFHESTWGVNPLEREENVTEPSPDVADLILPEIVPSRHVVLSKPKGLDNCWSFDCRKFLVRSEYKEAEDFVLSTCGTTCKALVVAGRPGIGSSLFCLHYGILGSFTRKIRFSAPSPPAASCAGTPYRATN